MCAKLLKHTPESGQGRLFRASERGFEAIIAFYGKTLKLVLRAQTFTLLVAVGTLVLTIYHVLHRPQRFLPDPGHRRIQGVLGGPEQSISFKAMAERQQELAAVILKDPAVRKPVVLHR